MQEMLVNKNTGRIVAGTNHDEEGCSESDRNNSDSSTFMTADNQILADFEHDSEKDDDACQHDEVVPQQEQGTSTCDSDTAAETEAKAEGVVQVSNQLEKQPADEMILELQREVRKLRRWNKRLVLQMNRMKNNKLR